MKGSLKKERHEANPHISKRGRHRNPGGGESSQVAQSQLVDPTLVLVYDTRDKEYDLTDQHCIHGPDDPNFQLAEVEDDEGEVEGEDEDKDQRAAHVVSIVGPYFPGGL